MRRFTSPFCAVMIGTFALIGAGFAASAQAQEGTDPTGNPISYTVQHTRMDEQELIKLGKGSIDAGMNQLGAMGYDLQIVTSVHPKGGAGYHFFRRGPWTRPNARPQVEFKRMDEPAVAKLGGGDFLAGLTALEKDRWEIAAVTTTASGGVGFYYFKRAK